MRWQLLTLFAMAGFALAQTPTQQPVSTTPGMVVQGGYASTPVTAPTVVTPHVTLTTASPNPVGATSSAYGLQVGATSAAVPSAAGPGATLNEAIVSTSSNSPVPITGTPAATIVSGPQQASANNQPAGQMTANEPNGTATTAATGFVPAAEPGPDVADAARYYRTHPMKAVKVYTNDDIARLNENTSNTANAGGSNLPASDMNAPAAAPSTGVMHPEAAAPQTDNMNPSQQQTQPSQSSAAPATAPKPKPYTPPATPPQQ